MVGLNFSTKNTVTNCALTRLPGAYYITIMQFYLEYLQHTKPSQLTLLAIGVCTTLAHDVSLFVLHTTA